MGAEDSQDVPSENRQGARRKEKWDVRGKRGAARGDTRQTQRDLPEWAGIKHQIRKTGEEGDQGLPPETKPRTGKKGRGGKGPVAEAPTACLGLHLCENRNPTRMEAG